MMTGLPFSPHTLGVGEGGPPAGAMKNAKFFWEVEHLSNFTDTAIQSE
jgi:hypothetical protein